MEDSITETRRITRENFLTAQGLGDVTTQPLQADASFRRYYRLEGADAPMLLMQDPPDRPAVPPFVMVEPFVAIADHLRSLGLRTPKIIAEDMANGLLLIEDFGDDTYTRLFNAGTAAQPLYELAVDALILLHRHSERNALKLPVYSDDMLVNEAMLLMDWFYPYLTNQKPSEELRASFAAVWKDLFAKFPNDQNTLVLRDYHVDNLMVVQGATGIQSCGLLDFQDAVTGQFSYDLMSLLEDARRDVSQDLQRHLYDRYMTGMGGIINREQFDYAYRVLAAQRHAKVLGIFVRLFLRDSKDRYLQFIPHVQKLFLQSLHDPILAPLRQWFEAHDFDIEKLGQEKGTSK
jgi:hypothetical protein